MEITQFKEFDWLPYPCFRHAHEFEKGKWRIPQFGNKIPLVYALKPKKVIVINNYNDFLYMNVKINYFS